VVCAMAVSSSEKEPVVPRLRDGTHRSGATEAPAHPASAHSVKGTVLVTDDDEALRDSVVEILGLAGYGVLEAADGDEALRVLSNQSVDVVLLDLQMPGMDGISVLEALEPPPPKVILLSAFARYSPEDIGRMGLAGKVTRALRKPVPPIELLAAISDVLGETPREG
jgi:CheY-like chemotaxis protein